MPQYIAKVVYKSSSTAAPETWMDTTDKTADAGNMLSGITALKNDGSTATGDIPSKSSSDLTVSGATVTAPAGFYDSAASKSVSTATQATPSISVNSSTGLVTASATQTAGYVSAGTKSSTEQLSTQAGKTVTPTESEQTAVVAGKFTTGAVKVAGISSTYVGSGIDQNDSDDLTVSGATVTTRAGYYAEDASKSVATGTAGTPTATKGTVSNHAVSVTPSVTNTTGYITGGTKNGTAVSVSASELVSGTKTISASGTTDVTNYASASVAAGSATTPATTITANPSISVSSSGLITATASASQSVTPTVTEGYVSSGTAGTVSVSGSNTEQLSTQAAATITPSTSQQTAVAAGKYTTGAVVVDPIPSQYIIPSGTLSIVENDTGIDVSQYASVDVAVPSSGGVTVNPLNVSANGTYTAPSGTAYSPVTVNVEGGGGAAASAKDVNFIDYDGTILYSYTASEAQALTELPANPSHSGLVAQGWNWTLEQIKSQLTAVPDGPVWIGQMYITQSGATEIDVTMTAPDLHPYLGIAVNGTVTIDWGDNTTADTVTGSSNTVLKFTGHEYAADGDYTISITVSSGRFTFYCNANSSNLYRSVLSETTAFNYSGRYTRDITAVRLGENAYLGNYAFHNCTELKSITITDNVTSIGEGAFLTCYSLPSFTVPYGVTSIGSNAFGSCYALANVAVPNSVTSIGANAFRSCYPLTSITIHDGVRSIGDYAFQYCSALESVIIPNSVTTIGTSAFSGCYVVASIKITNSGTSIASYAFNNCFCLVSITIPYGITVIAAYMFYNCYALPSITIPNSVTSIGNYAFSGCYTFASITIPDSVKTIGTYAFYNCRGIREMHFNATTPPTVSSSNAFTNALASGATIYVPAGSLSAYTSATNYPSSSTYTYVEE